MRRGVARTYPTTEGALLRSMEVQHEHNREGGKMAGNQDRQFSQLEGACQDEEGSGQVGQDPVNDTKGGYHVVNSVVFNRRGGQDRAAEAMNGEKESYVKEIIFEWRLRVIGWAVVCFIIGSVVGMTGLSPG